MRGEVNLARSGERVGKGVAADGLQRISGRTFEVAVIDHQSGAVAAHDTAGEAEPKRFRAPFINCADRSGPHSWLNQRVEMWDRVRRKPEDQLVIRRETNNALMPAV